MKKNKHTEPTSPPETETALPRDAIGGRIVFSMLCLGLCMFAALVEVFLLQTVHSEDLKAEATRQYGTEVPLDSWRGDIVDRDGALLAATVHRWALTADPSQISAETAPQTAHIIGELLDRDPEALKEKISAQKKRGSSAGMNDPASRVVRETLLPLSDK
ncbi:MAG: hypothetical protein VX938_11670, partial [Myxococcota bacterium]|nr:hypothetical protein [Myxococcota bacterium]